MSRFVTLLRERSFTLIASLPANDPELSRAALEGGADVIKVHINVHHRASGMSFGSLQEERERLAEILRVCGRRAPVGIVPGGPPVVEADLVEALRDMGFDFISAYAHHLCPACLSVEGIGKMVAADFSYSSDEIAALAQMAFDVFEASITRPETYGERLSLRDLATYRKLCDTVSQPVVVPTQRVILPGEVGQLAQAGSKAVMAGAIVTGRTAESIYETVRSFREEISKLDCPGARCCSVT
ncbi:MAG: hypothetical protein AB1700_06370 [Bacillota bacterium]